jgi:hypothetical protein
MLVLHILRLIRVIQHRQDNKTKDLITESPLRESKERYEDLLTVDPAQTEH